MRSRRAPGLIKVSMEALLCTYGHSYVRRNAVRGAGSPTVVCAGSATTGHPFPSCIILIAEQTYLHFS